LITPMLCFFEDIWKLECYSEGQQTVYSAPMSWYCDLLVGSSDNTTAQEPLLTLYPNPVSGRLNVSIPGVFGGRVRIIDLLSKEILTRTYTGSPLDVSLLDPGIYLLEFETGNSKFISRFIKQ
jgi:hypothetical protein